MTDGQVARGPLVALFFLAMIAPGRSAALGLPRVDITLPPDVPSEKVDIHYFMTGTFGGYGSFVRQQPNLHSYQIEGSVDGKPAAGMKILVYAPGCGIVTFDLTFTGSAVVERAFFCRPLPSVVLAGKIVPRRIAGNKAAEVGIVYAADWACDFFGLADCAVVTIPVATAVPNTEGIFHTQIPDFARNPIASSFRRQGFLYFLLREPKSGNIIAFLEVAGHESRAGRQPVQLRYPKQLRFVARKR
jgi:hypothetical protein